MMLCLLFTDFTENQCRNNISDKEIDTLLFFSFSFKKFTFFIGRQPFVFNTSFEMVGKSKPPKCLLLIPVSYITKQEVWRSVKFIFPGGTNAFSTEHILSPLNGWVNGLWFRLQLLLCLHFNDYDRTDNPNWNSAI